MDRAVEKAIPLKQGLKPASLADMTSSILRRKGNSIKTRIETLVLAPYLVLQFHVEKAIPLKQGLKLG